MTTISARLQAVHDRIGRAARMAGRPASDITLIAVSKTFPVEKIIAAYEAGQCAFGESYVQEGVEKVTRLSRLPLEWPADRSRSDVPRPSAGVASPQGPLLRPLEWPAAHPHRKNDQPSSDVPRPSAEVASPQGPLLRPLEWHFIGPIQSNKTRLIAEHFDWVHSVEREKIAARLNEARPAGLPPLNVCIQVNISGEGSKSGIAPGGELALARAIIALPRLRLRGLMAIPEPTPDVQLQQRRFALLRELRDKLVAAGIPLDTLSMGMSDDLEAAIAEGATIVRVGTAIFGKRREM